MQITLSRNRKLYMNGGLFGSGLPLSNPPVGVPNCATLLQLVNELPRNSTNSTPPVSKLAPRPHASITLFSKRTPLAARTPDPLAPTPLTAFIPWTLQFRMVTTGVTIQSVAVKNLTGLG